MARALTVMVCLAASTMWMPLGCSEDEPPVSAPELPLTDALTQVPPAECGACHTQHYDEWTRSMHAYAGTDPVWFALAARAHEDTGGEIGDFCQTCHVPSARLAGPIPQPLIRSQASEEVLRGVDCGFCHTIDRFTGITSLDADFQMATTPTVFGTIQDPVATVAHQSEVRSSMSNSAFCGTCHELRNTLGTTLELTYSEWLDSEYVGRGIECNHCHMPTYRGRATGSSPERDLHRHTFVGVDVALEDVPERALQIAETRELLTNTAGLTMTGALGGDTLSIDVHITNASAGHALPSGATMERQMWIELTVRDAGGTPFFVSGDLDSGGDLKDQHSELEPDGDPQLAIFHSVLRDATGNPTPFMWKAASIESRLVPPLSTETVHFEVPVSDRAGPYELDARLLFRALPPHFLRTLELGHLVEFLPIFEMTTARTSLGG